MPSRPVYAVLRRCPVFSPLTCHGCLDCADGLVSLSVLADELEPGEIAALPPARREAVLDELLCVLVDGELHRAVCEPCPACGGSGTYDAGNEQWPAWEPCETCDGAGERRVREGRVAA